MRKFFLLAAFGSLVLSGLANAENKDTKDNAVVVSNVSANENDDPATPPPPPPVTYRRWVRDLTIPVSAPDDAITMPTVIYTAPAQTMCFQATPVSPLTGGHNYGYYYTTSTSYTTSDMIITWGGCPIGGN